MINGIFINMPITNLVRTVEFFGQLGFTFNEQFTDEESTCMIIGENMYAMLCEHRKFKTFIKKEIAAPTTTEAIFSLSCDSPETVRSMAEKAFALGGKQINEAEDMGFMFSWAFEDLDGHLWDLFWMNPDHVQPTE